MPIIILIAAVAKNRVIGCDNRLIWHFPEDMAHFKAATLGHAVLMGRRTWESLPQRFRPLSGRRNMVLTRQLGAVSAGVESFASLNLALQSLGADETVFVIGGADLYQQTLPLAQGLMLTEIELEPEGDVYFPLFSQQEWHASARMPGVSANGLRYAFVTYERRPMVDAALLSHGVHKD